MKSPEEVRRHARAEMERIEVTTHGVAFVGLHAERDADRFLHESSLTLEPGRGVVAEVRVSLTNGRHVTGLHRMEYGHTDGSIRAHLIRVLEFLLHHEHCADVPMEEVRGLHAALSKGCMHRYTVLRLLRLALHPPGLDLARGVEGGRMEHHAALLHALQEGVSPEEAARRARSAALRMAPRVLGRWEYQQGVALAQEECRRVLEARPLRGCWRG